MDTDGDAAEKSSEQWSARKPLQALCDGKASHQPGLRQFDILGNMGMQAGLRVRAQLLFELRLCTLSAK